VRASHIAWLISYVPYRHQARWFILTAPTNLRRAAEYSLLFLGYGHLQSNHYKWAFVSYWKSLLNDY